MLKQTVLIALLIFLSPTIVYAVDYCSDANVQGCWLLNETSGNAKDLSANDNDGTLGAGITQGVSGQFGTAYDTDGAAGSDVDFATEGDYDITTNLSFGFWFNSDIAGLDYTGWRDWMGKNQFVR